MLSYVKTVDTVLPSEVQHHVGQWIATRESRSVVTVDDAAIDENGYSIGAEFLCSSGATAAAARDESELARLTALRGCWFVTLPMQGNTRCGLYL